MLEYGLASYRQLIRHAQRSGYDFAPLRAGAASTRRTISLRHDVDYSLEMAARLAEVNSDLSVSGTFFVLLRSQIYNLLSPSSRKAAARIAAHGQRVALHFLGPPDVLDDSERVAAALRWEYVLLRHEVSAAEPVFSWHNPSPTALNKYETVEEIGGLVNVYGNQLFREITYLSDTNLRHRVEDLLEAVGADGPRTMQLLLHPLNWVGGGRTMADVFARTWPHIIREREHDMLHNRFYAQAFPKGMPNQIVDGFVASWSRAVGDRR
jgi:hypothetical protein